MRKLGGPLYNIVYEANVRITLSGIAEHCLLLSFYCNTIFAIRFVSASAKFGICSVVGLNGALVEDKMRRLKGKCEHFSFNKCPI
jgi:hypothetical protein